MPALHMRETKALRKVRTEQIIKLLKRAHPDAHCALNHSNAFELLVATILSAQCTDERVNIVTADLFRKYRKPEDYLKVPATELQQDIRTTGFFRNKTKSIQGACKMLVEESSGEVPRTMEELLKLPGVGRKTANVVLGNAFGSADGVVVDTHVGRIARRLGWTRHTDPEKVERDLNRMVPQESWVFLPHALIYHGRAICTARNPLCESCSLFDLCPRIGVAPRSARKPGSARARAAARRTTPKRAPGTTARRAKPERAAVRRASR